jgi:alpha-D-ribose 1-methylphosphonate 5-triphosphate synthase subunit PhnL
MKAGAVLEIRGLGKDFVIHQLDKTLRACHGISLSVGAGQFVALPVACITGQSIHKVSNATLRVGAVKDFP